MERREGREREREESKGKRVEGKGGEEKVVRGGGRLPSHSILVPAV